jgi:hypothetical protein
LTLTKHTLCQRTSYITIDILIEVKLLQLQRLFKNEIQKILYKVITSNTQVYGLENTINSAFNFLCRKEICLQSEETIIRNDPDFRAEERKAKILSIIHKKIPNHPLRQEMKQRIKEISETINYDEMETDYTGLRMNARAKKVLELARINN